MANPPASSVKAGIAYAGSVFAIGFLLGTARVLLLAPRVGSIIAVSVETPIILAASWFVSDFWMKSLAVRTEPRMRILAGAVAFVTLFVLEVALSIAVFHRSINEYLVGLGSPAGAIGFAAQVCFATFPLLDILVQRRSKPSSHARL